MRFTEPKKTPSFRVPLLLLFLCFFSSQFAQVLYSVNPKYLRAKTESNNIISDYRYAYPDTTLTELSNFFPRNFLGNTGLPSPEYFLKYGSSDLGFRFFEPPVNGKFLESDVQYFRSAGPFANLTGIAGSRELQIFKMIFTHTYRDKVNITLKFNRYTSKGFYKRQQTYTNNFFLSSNYETKNRRLGYFLYVMNNSNKNHENGGLRGGRLTDTTALQIKEVVPINISGANRDNRELKAMLNPYLRLNKRSDSVHRIDHYFQLKSKFLNRSYLYIDKGAANDGYYAQQLLDTVLTRDSSHLRQFTNEADYTVITRKRQFALSVGIKNEITQLWQRTDTLLVNNIVQADALFRKKLFAKDTLKNRAQAFENHFNIQYVYEGPNLGNLRAEGKSVLLREKSGREFFFFVLYESRNPDFIYNRWRSNHFEWTNNFSNQELLQYKFGLNMARFHFSFFQESVNNFLYFDADAHAAQYGGVMSNTGVTVRYSNVFLRHLGMAIDHTYQSTTQPKYLRMPKNVTTAKIFYHGNLFKNNLQLQVGAQLQVYEAFKAYAYMPATQVFYLQDNSTTSPYPYLDVYLNARIRPVSFFLKMENVLQGYSTNNYFLVPGYYQPDRAFRFGLSWMFFD